MSEIEDLIEETMIDVPVEHPKLKRNTRNFIRAMALKAQARGDRAGFFSHLNRPTPSLPKLKFLEGKDE